MPTGFDLVVARFRNNGGGYRIDDLKPGPVAVFLVAGKAEREPRCRIPGPNRETRELCGGTRSARLTGGDARCTELSSTNLISAKLVGAGEDRRRADCDEESERKGS